MTNKLSLAQTRNQIALWNKFQPVSRVAATDTYKRTMSGSGTIFSDNFACYNLAARRPLNEQGIGEFYTEEITHKYIMAGLEKLLYPWFMNPILKDEVEEAEEFFTTKSQVKTFPKRAWQKVLDNDGFLPIDIYGFPGGQTFLVKDKKYVPMMSVEGMGALVSHLEPHLAHIFPSLIRATKARLMREVTGPKFAEFGLRADEEINSHVPLMIDLYIGGGFGLTSDDQAVFLFPKYFKDIGTVGHEFIEAYQKKGLSLEEAQMAAFREFVKYNQRSALLPDTIHTLGSGIPAIIQIIKENEGKGKIIIPRFDSGDVNTQAAAWVRMALEEKVRNDGIVVEDGYTPEKALRTRQTYFSAGCNQDDVIVGAGGYFKSGAERDDASLAYKRSATMHDGVLEPNMKLSDDPGKNSIPGRIRVYEKDRTLIVAQTDEEIDGNPLYVQLVKNGRINYFEDLDVQRERANRTWRAYDRIEYSDATQRIIDMRVSERDQILKFIGGSAKK